MTKTRASQSLPCSLVLVSAALLLGSCDTAIPTPAAADRHALAGFAQQDDQRLELATSQTNVPSGSLGSGKTCGPAGVTSPPADVCPPSRLVGYFPNVDCPAPSAGWTVEPLFVGSKTPLGRYCRYLWTGNPASPGYLPKSLSSKLQPDCRVFPQSPMSGALAPAYEQAFGQGTQPIPSSTPLPGGTTVRIAVLDTAPKQTSNGQSSHGPSIAAIAAELASGCVPGLGEATCRRAAVTTLALPQTRTGPDASKGGYFGYQSELAEGLVALLDDFPDPNGGDQRLVVNLAVGWEPKLDEFTNPSPAVQAVRDAIAIAQCRGALVVAASGNRPPGTCMAQPTGPGAWASEPGMTAAQCQALGLAPADIELPVPLHAYHPFLHAATPLDWSQQNLADFRDGSNAKLAATGFAGFDVRTSGSYGPMSGSSVSTAVVSGVAALVWSYFPTLGADALMQLLHDSGSSTSRTASLALLPPNMLVGPPQKQVGACAALQYACSNWQSAANSQPSVCNHAAVNACPNTMTGTVNAAAFASAFDQAFTQLPPGEVGSTNGPRWTTLECTGCTGAPRRVELPPSLGSEPPDYAWVLPQPQKAPCPVCKLKQDKFYVSLDPVYDPYTLLDLNVTLTDSAGVTKVLYYGGSSVLPTLSSQTVQVIVDAGLLTVSAAGSSPDRAYVHMVFDTGSTIISAGNQIPVN